MKDLDSFIKKCEATSIPDEQINTEDIPELTETDFARGHFKYWKPAKKAITFRIDIDNLSWLQSSGTKGYQTKLNDVIRWARQNGCPLLQKKL